MLQNETEIINAVSGALAGALTATFVCPLDVLKTRLQVQRIGSAGQRVGIAGGLAGIVRAEGPAGLYRGLSPTLVALLPNWAVYFTVYGRLKEALAERHARRCEERGLPPPPLHGASAYVHMAAAAGAGVATLTVTNPLWVVKTRMQTQNLSLSLGEASGDGGAALRARLPYRGTLDALTRIAREEGMRGLYSGLAPSMAGVCHVAIQFPLYEAAKQYAAQRRGCDPDALDAAELVVASAVSKMVASTATYPHEVIRSYMHVTGSGPLKGLAPACATIWREDGARGFYRGCLTNLLRTTPAAALTFTSFELIARFLRRQYYSSVAAAPEGGEGAGVGLLGDDEEEVEEEEEGEAGAVAAGGAAGLGWREDEEQGGARRQHQHQQQQCRRWRRRRRLLPVQEGCGRGGGGGRGGSRRGSRRWQGQEQAREEQRRQEQGQGRQGQAQEQAEGRRQQRRRRQQQEAAGDLFAAHAAPAYSGEMRLINGKGCNPALQIC